MRTEADQNAAGGVTVTAEFNRTNLESGETIEDINFQAKTDNTVISEYIQGNEKIIHTILADGTSSEERIPVDENGNPVATTPEVTPTTPEAAPATVASDPIEYLYNTILDRSAEQGAETTGKVNSTQE